MDIRKFSSANDFVAFCRGKFLIYVQVFKDEPSMEMVPGVELTDKEEFIAISYSDNAEMCEHYGLIRSFPLFTARVGGFFVDTAYQPYEINRVVQAARSYLDEIEACNRPKPDNG